MTIFYVVLLAIAQIGPIIDSVDKFTDRFIPKEMSDEELRLDSLELSRDIFEFIEERKSNEPEIDYNNWEESIADYTKYHSNSKEIYNSRFGRRLSIVREEYAKRVIYDEAFDMFYKNPTNYFGMTDVASRLAAMSTYLK